MPASISGLETKFRKSGTGSRKKGMAIRIMLRSHFALNCKKYVTVQHPVKGTLIFGQNRENKISVSSLL